MLATRCTATAARPLGIAPPRRKSASGGLRPIPRLRLSRWHPQPTDASGKYRPGHDPLRRDAALPQKGQNQCPTLGQRRENHDQWVARNVQKWRAAGYKVATEVSFKVYTAQYPKGIVARADYVVRLPGSFNQQRWLISELKTGDADLTKNQSVVYGAEIRQVVGANGIPVGLRPNSWLPMVGNTMITRCPGL